LDILVVGSGGREHALCWALSNSSHKPKLYCAPGNAGIAKIAECVDVMADDIPGLLDWVRRHEPVLVIIGPEVPLSLGLADALQKTGVWVFGPVKAGAELEASKTFTKKLMVDNHIPTAKADYFKDYKKALAYVRNEGAPIVIKADGLAAGKGVTVCENLTQAERALEDAMVKKVFGEAGTQVLIEECLVGEEASVLAFVDGETIVPMVSAQDHKRAFDGDQGPNTGGMGAYSPAPVVTPELDRVILEKILKPTVAALKSMGIIYRGVLYAGLMMTPEGPKVIEYNCRFGDPETQVVLPRLKTDFVDVCMAVARGNLSKLPIEWDRGASACVVMAAKGYPGSYPKGQVITGLEKASERPQSMVFHSGTASRNGEMTTNGGRVLCVTGLGENIQQAVQRAYETLGAIHFEGAHFRKDIAWRALNRR
jgi:phosphoribosylamine--glycine ligase